MKYTLHPFYQLDPSLLPVVARLHQSSLRVLLSDMGYPFIYRYLEVASHDPAVIGYYAVSDINDVIGYVVGSPDSSKLNRQLLKPYMWFLSQCIRLLFTRPLVLLQVIISSLTLSRQIEDEKDAIELVYVCVASQSRGHGVGQALLKAFQAASAQIGYKRVAASQELDNEASVKLFSSLGYRVKYKYREGSYHRQRVELSL